MYRRSAHRLFEPRLVLRGIYDLAAALIGIFIRTWPFFRVPPVIGYIAGRRCGHSVLFEVVVAHVRSVARTCEIQTEIVVQEIVVVQSGKIGAKRHFESDVAILDCVVSSGDGLVGKHACTAVLYCVFDQFVFLIIIHGALHVNSGGGAVRNFIAYNLCLQSALQADSAFLCHYSIVYDFKDTAVLSFAGPFV